MKALVKSLRGGALKQFSDLFGGGWGPLPGYGGATGSPSQITRAINVYGGTDESSAAVFACVRKIADEMAAYPWQLLDAKDQVIKPEAIPEDLDALLKEPMPDTTYFDYCADVGTDLELVGNSFWLCEEMNALQQPRYMERLDPAMVQIATDQQDRKIGYVLNIRGRQIPFGLADIVHFRTRNPLNKHLGMGTVEAIFREVEADLAETAHVAAFFRNGARIAGVLTIPENLDDVQFQRLQQQVAEQDGSPHAAYRTLIAEKTADFKPVTQAPVASGVIELRRLSQDAIYKAFGVPEFLLGGTSQGGVYKMSEAQFIFYRNMLPRARRYQERMTLSLVARWEGRKFQTLPEMNEPPEDMLDNASKMLQTGASLNEARKKAGEPEIDDPRADEPLLPSGYLPWSFIAAGKTLPGAAAGPAALTGLEGAGAPEAHVIDARPLRAPRPSQRPALPAPDENRLSRKAAAEEGEVVDAEVVIKQPPLPAGYEVRTDIQPKIAQRDAVQELIDGQAAFLASATPEMRQVFVDFFNGQRKRVIARLYAAERGINGSHPKHEARRKALTPESVWDDQAETTRLLEVYARALLKLGKEAVQVPARIVNASIRWDQGHPLVQRAIEEMGRLIVRINETTRQAISHEIVRGVERGYSVPQIANGNPDENYDGIAGVFDEASAARAETIARSETAMLFNASANVAYEESDIGHVEVLDGTEYDEKCRKANRQIWTTRKARKNPIEHPNCVRAFAPVVGDLADVEVHDLKEDPDVELVAG